ncbi:helix-turn-helix transcriptional regulator [Pilimelia terevasa]|uniref:helix-turn-helix transcriptional regulator n=1 Tax=Pilimelia terevasa TaxID=53372 RepID=UPI00166E5CB6|nr:helix-turn-helix transcriptional regulator [Pilimelia terevasa]
MARVVVAVAGRMSDLTPDASPAHRFGAALRSWRIRRGLSQQGLADLVFQSAQTVAKTERAERWPSRELAASCDKVLVAGGELEALWPPVRAQQLAADRRRRAAGSGASHDGPGGAGR